jgi:hypothetical protein
MNQINNTYIPSEDEIILGLPPEDYKKLTNFKIKTTLDQSTISLSTFSISTPVEQKETPIEMVEKKSKKKGQNLF